MICVQPMYEADVNIPSVGISFHSGETLRYQIDHMHCKIVVLIEDQDGKSNDDSWQMFLSSAMMGLMVSFLASWSVCIVYVSADS
jgi:hypothetical protein